MRISLVLVATLLAGPLQASQVLVDAERVHLDRANISEYGFRVEVGLFDSITDEYSVAVSAPHQSMHRTFSHYYVGRYDSLAVEVTPEMSNEKHDIRIYLPLDGFDVDETEITVVFEGDGVKPVFFKIDIRNFIELTNTNDR